MDASSRLALFALGYAVTFTATMPIALAGSAVCGLMAVGFVATGFHEALHGNLPLVGKRVQAVVARIFAAPLGLSCSYWRIKHLRWHHPHVGDAHRDPDIAFGPLGRAKSSEAWRPTYRFQGVFFLVLAPLATLNMLRPAEIRRVIEAGPAQTAVRLYSEKYLAYLSLWLPLLLARGILPGLVLLVTFHLVSGGFGSVVAQLQHNTAHANRRATRGGNWFERQFTNTADTRSRFGIWWWLSGGTSRHVVHHLLPSLTYVELPGATRALRRVVEPGLVWPEHSGVRDGLVSLAHHIGRMSRPETHSE